MSEPDLTTVKELFKGLFGIHGRMPWSGLALVYEGEHAVSKIRDVLGPTDPSQAPGGTVRREFGSDVMVNTAHASDSPENARREMAILGIHTSGFLPAVTNALDEIYG